VIFFKYMDISLLSQLIKELLPVKGSLTLPRIGVFRTENVPAWFSENGRVINPPSKKITFGCDFDPSDTTLVEEYAVKIGAGVEELKEQSETFFSSLLSEKYRTGFIVFPGFGKLDFTHDGPVIFLAEGAQDLFSERYGLEPLNLKKIDSSGPEEEEYVVLPDAFGKFPFARSGQKDTVSLEEQPRQAAPAPETPVPAPKEPVASVRSEEKAHRGWIITVSILLGVLIIAAVIVFMGRKGSLDSLLYSEEELQLIESAGSGR